MNVDTKIKEVMNVFYKPKLIAIELHNLTSGGYIPFGLFDTPQEGAKAMLMHAKVHNLTFVRDWQPAFLRRLIEDPHGCLLASSFQVGFIQDDTLYSFAYTITLV